MTMVFVFVLVFDLAHEQAISVVVNANFLAAFNRPIVKAPVII